MISEVFTFPNSCIIKFEAKYGVKILNFILCAEACPYFTGTKTFSRVRNFWNVRT